MPELALLEPVVGATIPPRPLGLPSVQVLSVAGALPPGRVSSAELAAHFGVSEEWIVSRTGIRERPRARPQERLSELAAAAGDLALSRAGVCAADLDLIIVATITPDELTPASAAHVAAALGAHRAGALDIGAACTGFLTGLAMAAGQIESGRARRVLLIGADFVSRITDHEDRRTAPLFADGAGAMVIVAGPLPATGSARAVATPTGQAGQPAAGWVGPVILGVDGAHTGTLYADERRMLVMDGPEVFRHAVARMHEASLGAIDAVGLSLDDVALLVPHQANARITRALRERLGLSEARVVDCIDRIGNASAATLPLGLATAQAEGRLDPGTNILLTAFGAGFSWGACVLQWGGCSRPLTALTPSAHSSASGASAPHRV